MTLQMAIVGELFVLLSRGRDRCVRGFSRGLADADGESLR